MNKLGNIRSMKDLEYQRALLQLKAAGEEQRLRHDMEAVKADYMPVVRGVNSIRSGVAKIKVIAPIVLSVFKLLISLRGRRKK